MKVFLVPLICHESETCGLPDSFAIRDVGVSMTTPRRSK